MSLLGWTVWNEKWQEYDVILRKEWSRYDRTVQPQHKVVFPKVNSMRAYLALIVERKAFKTTACRVNVLRLRAGAVRVSYADFEDKTPEKGGLSNPATGV